MTIEIINVNRETWIVLGTFLLLMIATVRRKTTTELFPKTTTVELKGLAIILVVCAHIGYFLVTDHRFLTPLSNYAGVGVDLFLLLSGYGLAISHLKQPLKPWQFYKKRLGKIYWPVWLTLGVFLLADWLILHQSYPLSLTIKNFLGFFPQADLYRDLDSPLWFITLLLGNYFIFPLIFRPRAPYLGAILITILGWWYANINISAWLGVTPGVATLHSLHSLAFPVGLFLAVLIYKPPKFLLVGAAWIAQKLTPNKNALGARWLASLLAILGAYEIITHTAVGQSWKIEELMSVLSALALVGIAILLPVRFAILNILGAVSFEIYLWHWPLLYRYDYLFARLPAGVAVLLYFLLFTALGYGYQFLMVRLQKKRPLF